MIIDKAKKSQSEMAEWDKGYIVGYEKGRADAIKSVFAKIGQPNECLFNYQSACCYPIDDCMNCPITIDEMKN